MSTASDADLVSVVGDRLMFLCPGCEERSDGWASSAVHCVQVGDNGWTWNGSTESPTFTPSVLVNRGRMNPAAHVCHSFVTDGQIRFLGDCSHSLAGQTVDLMPWVTRYLSTAVAIADPCDGS